MSKKIKRILKENLDLVVGGISILGIYLLLAFLLPILLNTSTPIAYISSGSMEPTYYTGDLVIIKGVKGKEIHVGDVIVFQPIGYKDLILHRVAAKKYVDGKYYFLTKGDNPRTNIYIDGWGWVPEDRVKGKVIGRIPLIGYVFMLISTIEGKLLILLTIFVLLMLDFSDEKNQDSIKKNVKIRFNRKNKAIIVATFIIMLLLYVTFTSYIYIGEKTPDVKLEGIGEPLDAFSFKVYPLYIKIESYGLTGGYVKRIEVTPVRVRENKNASTVVWSIIYSYIGSKDICLDIFLGSNESIYDYVIYLTFYVEKIGESNLVFKKIYYPSNLTSYYILS